MATPAVQAPAAEKRVAHPIDAPADFGTGRAWYALRTRSNFEFTVAAALAGRVDTFIPYFVRRHRMHGQDLTRRRALFPGYVFVSADLAHDRILLLSTRGVVAMIGGRRPEPIPAAVIENLRIAAQDPAAIAPALPREGETVTVVHGPLAGLSGVMERVAGRRRLIVRVDFLGRACALEIGEAEVYSSTRSAA